MTISELQNLSRYLRYQALRISTLAGSGHPTSSLSATDLMGTLLAEFFRYDFSDPKNPANDRLIFSKGHATPLYYSLFAAAGVITEKELATYRKFGSILEGHPTFRFPYAEAATGSLGQGLSIGVGEALAIKSQSSEFRVQNSEFSNQKPEINNKLFSKRTDSRTPNSDFRTPNIFVLLGDGEMAEGSVWEAMEIAAKYNLDNLVAIIDVNKFGQSGETMSGHDTAVYEAKAKAFGWNAIVIDGHDFGQIREAFSQVIKSGNLHGREMGRVTQEGERQACPPKRSFDRVDVDHGANLSGGGTRNSKPTMIIARTQKGKGISFLEGKAGWHGKPLKPDQFELAVKELGKIESVHISVRRPFSIPSPKSPRSLKLPRLPNLKYKPGDPVATRMAYGNALVRLGAVYKDIVVLDAEVKNSTYSEFFKDKFPDRFFEMYIAEQNMVGTAVGMARMGKIPFVSTFAAFLTRAFDQIRMAALSGANIKLCGSHAGVSIGEDGPSQMGLEDLAMFQTIHGSTVLYPADAVSAEKLVEEMVKKTGICYLRTSRPTTPVIYDNREKFPLGGSKIHQLTTHNSQPTTNKRILIVAAGITLYEALKAQEELVKDKIEANVVDCYSIKPIDVKTLQKLAKEVDHIITVEDHWSEGGLGDAVLNAFSNQNSEFRIQSSDSRTPASPAGRPNSELRTPIIHKLSVTKMPRSGKPAELLSMEGIDSVSIVRKAKEILD